MTKTTEEVVCHIKDWAVDRIASYNKEDVTKIYDQLAIIDEYAEWLNLDDEEIEVVSLEEITEDEYEDFIERG